MKETGQTTKDNVILVLAFSGKQNKNIFVISIGKI